jgi:starch-binding outer membrane protein, SusD/RagB family
MKRIASIVFFLLLFSCDIEQPLTNQLNQGSYWRNDQDALDALSSCYQNILPNWDRFFSNEALSDNALVNGTSYEQVAQIANGGHNGLNPRVVNEWADQYTTIRRCNVVLENVDAIQGSTEQKINRYKAEAKFIRAWSYFHLVNYFGDVPLVLTTITVTESQNLRTDRYTTRLTC